MPHIQIVNTKDERRWINTDHIEHVSDMVLSSPMEVRVSMYSRTVHILRGKKALQFLDAYQRFCVASQRPEVG